MAPLIASALGLDSLGLSEDEYVELLRDIIIGLVGDRVTKPKPENVIKNIRRNESKIMSIIAFKLLEIIPENKLTPEQYEFVAANIGPLVIPVAQRLYKEAERLGLDVSPLQGAWEEGWRLRGDPGPVGYCPNCGFRAVAPDGSCMVCGKVLNDEELKEAVEFNEKFREFLETASCSELKEAFKRGSLYVSHASVSLNPLTKWDVEVLLSKEEREALRTSISRRCQPP